MSELCLGLSRHFEITVLAPHFRGALRRERIGGVEVIRYRYAPEALETLAYRGGILQNLRHGKWKYLLVPLLMLSQLVSVARLIRSSHYDLIHAHWLIPQGLIALIARFGMRHPPAVLCTSHGGDLYALDQGMAGKLMRLVARKVDALAVVSTAMQRHVRERNIRDRETEVIPMGVNLQERFTPAPVGRSASEFLFVGRLVPKKGVDTLIRAMHVVVQHRPGVTLVIIGDGPEKASLLQLADQLEVGGNITFAGALTQDELPDRYRRCTGLVFPSVVAADNDQEGLGLVLVEALGCECPVICSDLEATRDVITHEETGLHYRPGDHATLARLMQLLLEDPAGAVRLGRQGRLHVLRHFDWGTIARRYADLIDRIIGMPGEASRGNN